IDVDPSLDDRGLQGAGDRERLPGGPQVGHVVADAHAGARRNPEIQIDLRQDALLGARGVVRLEEGGEDLAVEVDVAVEEAAVDGDAAGQLRPPLGRHAQREPAAQEGGEAVVEAVAHAGEGGFEPDRLSRRAASRQLDRAAVQEQAALLDTPAALAQGDAQKKDAPEPPARRSPRRSSRGPDASAAKVRAPEATPPWRKGLRREASRVPPASKSTFRTTAAGSSVNGFQARSRSARPFRSKPASSMPAPLATRWTGWISRVPFSRRAVTGPSAAARPSGLSTRRPSSRISPRQAAGAAGSKTSSVHRPAWSFSGRGSSPSAARSRSESRSGASRVRAMGPGVSSRGRPSRVSASCGIWRKAPRGTVARRLARPA